MAFVNPQENKPGALHLSIRDTSVTGTHVVHPSIILSSPDGTDNTVSEWEDLVQKVVTLLDSDPDLAVTAYRVFSTGEDITP